MEDNRPSKNLVEKDFSESSNLPDERLQKTLDNLQPTNGRSCSLARADRLRTLHKFLLMRVPYSKIAKHFGISESQVQKDVAELKKAIAKDAENLDINQIVGDSTTYYRDLAAQAMLIVNQQNIPLDLKLAAIRVGVSCQDKLSSFFKDAGIYDALKYKSNSNKASKEDIDTLVDLTKQVLSMEEDEDGNLMIPDSLIDSSTKDDDDLFNNIDIL